MLLQIGVKFLYIYLSFLLRRLGRFRTSNRAWNDGIGFPAHFTSTWSRAGMVMQHLN